MTNEELQEIRDRARAATPGPWLVSAGTGGWWVVGPAGEINTILISVGDSIKDAAFIAHSREDIPALLTHVDHLQAEIKHLNAELLRLVSPLPETEQMKALADRLPGM